jgi:ABC-2 type transport system permease protein
MSLGRVRALFRRVALEIAHDRPSLALLFFAPLVITGLVTFIIREGATSSLDVVIVNEAGLPGTVAGARLGEAIVSQGGSVSQAADETTARASVEDGSASVAIVLPPDLVAGDVPTITLVTNGLDPAAEAAQLGALQRAIFSTVAAASDRLPPTIEHVTLYGVPSDDPIARFAPALVGFFVYFFVYLLTGVSFLRERTGGTLERLMATPVSRSEIVVGYELGFGIFAMVQVAVIMLWALASLHIPAIGPLPGFSVGLGIETAGSALLAYLVVVVLALGAVSLGILVSTFARTELQIIEFIPIVLVPQFLFSGVLFPLSSLPAILQPLAAFMPLRYAVDGLRQVFIRGADLTVDALLIDLVVLAAFALLFGALASLTIRREVA